MTKTDLRRALERATGSPFIKASQLAKFVGDKNVSRVRRKYLINCQCLPGKLYLCEEVAEYMDMQKSS